VSPIVYICGMDKAQQDIQNLYSVITDIASGNYPNAIKSLHTKMIEIGYPLPVPEYTEGTIQNPAYEVVRKDGEAEAVSFNRSLKGVFLSYPKGEPYNIHDTQRTDIETFIAQHE